MIKKKKRERDTKTNVIVSCFYAFFVVHSFDGDFFFSLENGHWITSQFVLRLDARIYILCGFLSQMVIRSLCALSFTAINCLFHTRHFGPLSSEYFRNTRSTDFFIHYYSLFICVVAFISLLLPKIIHWFLLLWYYIFFRYLAHTSFLFSDFVWPFRFRC